MSLNSRARYWLSTYWVSQHDIGDDRPFETAIHKIRDGYALLMLGTELSHRGMRFAGAVQNVPESVRVAKCLRETGLPLKRGDVVVQCTRPPLSDKDNDTKRTVDQSGGDFEQKHIWPRLRMLFANCDRSEVTLSDQLKPQGGRENTVGMHRSVRFYQENKRGMIRGGRVRDLCEGGKRRKPNDADLTIGYLVSLPRVQPSDFRFVLAFGLGGTETLWLSHLITHTRHRRYFDAALRSTSDSVWTIPFLVPVDVPYPCLQVDGFELDRFLPQKENRFVTQWCVDQPLG